MSENCHHSRAKSKEDRMETQAKNFYSDHVKDGNPKKKVNTLIPSFGNGPVKFKSMKMKGSGPGVRETGRENGERYVKNTI